MRVSIIIPVYNEARTIVEVLRRAGESDLGRRGAGREVIVVEDGSTDGTRELLERLRARMGFRLSTARERRGKGAAVREGLRLARGDLVVLQDADLEYDPRDHATLLRPLWEGRADAVHGSRYLRGARRERMSPLNDIGNRLLTLAVNALFGGRLTDALTGARAYRRAALGRLALASDGFSIETEMTAKSLRAGWRVREVPVRYEARGAGEGKKLTMWDGVRAFGTLLRVRLGG